MPENTLQDQLDVCHDSFDEKHLQEYLEHVASLLEISSPKFRMKICTKDGDNNMGIVYRVFIEGEKNGVPVKISTILKVPPRDETSRLMLQVSYFFPREQLFYIEIWAVFEDLLKTYNQFSKNIPKCYFASKIDHKEAICLEDLQPLGFVMRDRLKQMDFAHTSLTFSALGRFHAVSFALRDQKPEVFKNKIATLTEPLFRSDFINHESFTDQLEVLGNLVKIHSGEPQDLYFLDFQVARYASPATDISYTLFTSCSQELRKKHFDELIKIYHESLSNHLRKLGSDPDQLFPFEALLDQLKNFSRHAAGIFMLALPRFTRQGEDLQGNAAEIFDKSMLENRIQRDHFWRNTLRDAIKDLIDRNYI